MRNIKTLATLAVSALAVKVFFSLLPPFDIDMGAWLAWAYRLRNLGFAGFYSDSVWTQYTPGYLYWLWFLGKTGLVGEMAIKIPSIVADIVTGILIFRIVERKSVKLATLSFLAYTLNPVIIFNSSVWGQIDGLLTLFLFSSVFFAIEKKNALLSGTCWAIAFLIKPQAIALLPVLLLVWLGKFSLKQTILAIIASLSAVWILSLPFFPQNPALGLPELVQKMGDYYAYTSVYAYNVWTFVGMWKPDTQFFPVGVALYIISLAAIFFAFRRRLENKENIYLVSALSLLAFFLFPTRVHERYLFPFFAFLIVAAGIAKSKWLYLLYFLASVFHLANLYYPYAYYTNNFLKSKSLMNITSFLEKPTAIVLLFTFFGSIFRQKFSFFEKFSWPEIAERKKGALSELKFSVIKLPRNSARIILAGILLFAFVSRVAWLTTPSEKYFDEVYHAFTAQIMKQGDPKAWEWWNPHPTGFAYEWTHPPLAKEFMAGGMFIFGENAFGWRIPAGILGVGVVFLVYLIAKELFKDEALALFSAGVMALDGLVLVMSRIGMNDTYMLFFGLACVYLFLKQKYPFSATAFGLALASKWSALWILPILGIYWLLFSRKWTWKFVWFFLLPPAIYIASYIPMFLTGHAFDIFVGVQKQMWWYHTNLKATHAYTSPWWSWPVLARPIYLYTSQEVGGMVARIYAMGNPAVFWVGLAATLTAAYFAIVTKSKKLAFVVFSYFAFFVPWAASPRIMFLYHYLPSIPFLAIATGWFLRKNSLWLAGSFFVVSGLLFIYFFPHWAGMQVPLWLDQSYYWFPSWR